jgi:CRP-like cAMP-binding protein
MVRKKTPIDLLASVDLFQGLSKKEINKIYDAGKEVTFRQGRTIVSEGESGVGFHLIISGKAKVTVSDRLRGTLGPGDYFGEMAIIDRGPRSATVTAETDVTTLAVASWDFMPVLTENFNMAKKIMVELCRRLRGAEKSFTH